MKIFSRLFSKEKKETLDRGLERSRRGVMDKLVRAVAGKSRVDDEVLDELEGALVSADVGVDTTLRIIDRLQKRVARDKYVGTAELNRLIVDEVSAMLADSSADATGEAPATEDFVLPASPKPYVVMVVGVNGVGKTTTIGKLAAQYKRAGYKVVLGAADTFRAAATEQLVAWGERAGVPVVKQQQGSDPAAVAFDTVKSAVAGGADLVIIDTAGRLHNKRGLMEELTKIKRVMGRVVEGAPHEVLLVIDASTGQNAVEQARRFTEATDVNALAVTKLDGTAKGGVVIGISESMQIPVKYIGLGEGIDDLQTFDKRRFVESLFGVSSDE